MEPHWSERLAASRWLWPTLASFVLVNDVVIVGLAWLTHRIMR